MPFSCTLYLPCHDQHSCLSMDALNTTSTHPFFDSFMDSRVPGPPTDFECYMLNAILAMPANTPEPELDHQVPAVASAPPSTQVPLQLPRCAVGYSTDKLFPTQLLKCPLPIFLLFIKERGLHPTIVEALRDARRRKVNRKSQRITRNRRSGYTKCRTEESDDEGECSEIDGNAVYAEWVAASKAVMMPAV